jgi:alpha-mannosidase
VSVRRQFVVPHTHWDREWYRPFEHFRLELARVVDGVLDVLEHDRRFTSFTLDGQAIVLEDYLDVRPENEGRLRDLLSAGRLEAGPSYVLPDELLVGAEPLVRNLLMGREVCERFGVRPSPVGYLPDSFGHPLQLPQILAGFGIASFVFTRGLGDELDDVGVVFRWRAPDGSEVLAFQQLSHYGNFAAIADADDAEGRVRGILDEFGAALERAGLDELLLCNGSDHLPIQPELPSWCDELERRLPGTRATIARYEDYVREAEPRDVGALTGELLGSRLQNVLRGVNSARMYLKQANERAETRLLAVEALAALRALHDGSGFPRSDFRLAWRDLLRCQPHDSICGCSCDEVHRDMLVRYDWLHRTLSLLEARALDAFVGPDEQRGVGVVNLLPERRRGLVEVPGMRPALVELDGFTASSVELVPERRAEPAPGTSIESDLLRVDAGGDGTLTVTDKRTGRAFDHLHGLEDELDMGDLYNFCPVSAGGGWEAGSAHTRVLASGPVCWELEVRAAAERPAGLDHELAPLRETVSVDVRTVVRLVRGSERVEFRTTVENPAADHRLRVVFPVAGGSGSVRAEGAFALVRRPFAPPAPRAPWVEPPDATQHTLGVVALGPLALLTRGLPEYEARTRGDGAELCLTLLRCVGTISRPSGVLATRPHAAGPGVSTPEGQCLGRHVFEYALLTGADALDDLALLRAAQDYRHGLVLSGRNVAFAAPLALDGDVVFSCLKGAEDGDGLILRCFNPAGAPVRARIVGPLRAARTRLDETGEEPLPDGTISLRGHEVATVRLRPADT